VNGCSVLSGRESEGGIQIGCTAVEPCIILVEGNQDHPHARNLMSLHMLRHPRRRHHSPDNHTTPHPIRLAM
jgi:hypothetical protein